MISITTYYHGRLTYIYVLSPFSPLSTKLILGADAMINDDEGKGVHARITTTTRMMIMSMGVHTQ